ncbi:MAG: hypothetical protein JSR97_03890 [Verrucomicrobia bacterium]|nr:hypothetical protein [Verrucomicrobiota bacterium]
MRLQPFDLNGVMAFEMIGYVLGTMVLRSIVPAAKRPGTWTESFFTEALNYPFSEILLNWHDGMMA